jgi:hypothetical protein
MFALSWCVSKTLLNQPAAAQNCYGFHRKRHDLLRPHGYDRCIVIVRNVFCRYPRLGIPFLSELANPEKYQRSGASQTGNAKKNVMKHAIFLLHS